MEVKQQNDRAEAQKILDRISLVAKKKRLSLRLSQEDAAFEAGVTVKTVQSLEHAKNTHILKAMTYLAFLGLGRTIMEALPDPDRLTPIEQLEISKGKTDNLKRARVSRMKGLVTARDRTAVKVKFPMSMKDSPWKTK